MYFARTSALMGLSLMLGACATDGLSGSPMMAVPGPNKSLAAFQQDQSICAQHATAHTGYGGPSQPAAPNAAGNAAAGATPDGPGADTGAVPAGVNPSNEASFMQCMAARGNSVQMAPVVADYTDYAYAYPYGGYPYVGPFGYGYPYGYPYYGGGLFFGGGGWGGWHGGRWGRGYYGGYHAGGYHGGGYHGGGMARGGGHGGGGHH